MFFFSFSKKFLKKLDNMLASAEVKVKKKKSKIEIAHLRNEQGCQV